MDKLNQYKTTIKAILNEYKNIVPAHLPEVENELIIDEVGDHYQLMRIGFEDRRRVYYSVFHFDIINNKIYIQQDTTDIPVAQLLLDAGISKEDIVLAFHAPYKRAMTGMAVS